MTKSSTHRKVPATRSEQQSCFGPGGSAEQVGRVLQMLKGRWKLAIFFNLVAAPSLRTSKLLEKLPGISQKVLTEQLRQMAADGLIERVDFGEKPPRVEYRLSEKGKELFPVLRVMRTYAAKFSIY